MDIRDVSRACLSQYGCAPGVYPLTKMEYAMLSERTRIEYKMSPEDYLAGSGLNIKFEIL